MKRLTIDFTVGIFILIGICALAFLALRVAATSNFNSNSKQNYTIYANFTNIGSLRVNAPVKVSGFIVGRVANIELDPKTYQAVVTMDLNNNYKFSTDTSAQILTTGLLGEQYIALQSGSDSSYLQNGNTITITSSAMILENLIGKFMTNIGSK
jgi:phospholipid/cholesterol/gamma-HCH transport system substrate-binding protein